MLREENFVFPAQMSHKSGLQFQKTFILEAFFSSDHERPERTGKDAFKKKKEKEIPVYVWTRPENRNLRRPNKDERMFLALMAARGM